MTFGKPERHSREKMSFKDSAPPGVIIPFLLNSRFPPQSRERLWPDRQSALHLLMVMTASKETAVVMGFRFLTVLTLRLRSGGQRHFNLFPRSRRGDCGGWGTFLGCGEQRVSWLAGVGLGRPITLACLTRRNVPPPRMPIPGPALAPQRPESWGHRLRAAGATSGCARVNVTGQRWNPVRPGGRATRKSSTDQLSDFPTSLKRRFPWVGHALSLWNPTWTIPFPWGDWKKDPLHSFWASRQTAKRGEWDGSLEESKLFFPQAAWA